MRKPTPGLAVTAAFLAAAAVGGIVVTAPAEAAPAGAAPRGRQPRLSIATPATGNLVAGLVQVAVAFDAGAAGRITAVELWVDDLLYSSQTLDLAEARGTHTIDWDTLNLRNGQHSLKVRAYSGRKVVATDAIVVSVSNGGVDIVPPLISFYAPLEGQILSGNVNIGVHAADNDQVALVGLFVNRQLKMMKSSPPYQYTLDTTALPLLNGRGALVLEAWAYDRAQNRGIAKPITVYVHNRINATPMQPDPKAPKGTPGGPNPRPAAPSSRPPVAPEPPAVTKPEPMKIARLSPLDALLAPAPHAASKPATELKMPTPAAPAAAQPVPNAPAGSLTPANPRRVDVPLAPKPARGVRETPPPTGRPSRTEGAVPPRTGEPRLDVAIGAAPAARPTADGPRTVTPSRTPAARSVKPPLKPAPVTLKPIDVARVPEGELVAVPRTPEPAAVKPQPAATKSQAAVGLPTASLPAPNPKSKIQNPKSPVETARALPKPAAPQPSAATVKVARRKGTATDRMPAANKASRSGLQQGSTPDRVILPVYRLARLPETLRTSRQYTVRRGDSLGQIAKKHGVSPRSILVASGLDSGSQVTAGRRLSIPGTFTIAYNDRSVDFDVQPRVEEGLAIAPFRQIFEHTGGVVRYQPTEREVHASSPAKDVRLKIGSREALVNSAVVVMDRAAFLDSGRTMVPVKFMTEALDLKAEYDLKTGAIYLIKK